MSSQSSPFDQTGMMFAAAAPDPSVRPEPVRLEPEPEPAPPKGPSAPLSLLFVALGLAAGYYAYQLGSQPGMQVDGGGPTMSGSLTATAVRGDFEETIRLSGTLIAESFAAIRAPQIRTGRRFSGGGGGGGGAGGPGGGGGGGGSPGGGGGGALTLITMADPGSRVEAGKIVAEFDRQSQQQMIEDQLAQVSQAQSMIDMRRAALMVLLETKRQEAITARAEYGKAELDLRTAEVRSEIQAEILKNLMQEAKAKAEQLEQEVKLMEIAHKAQMRAVEIDKQQEEIDLRRAEMNTEHLELKTPIAGIVVMQTVFRNGTFAQVNLGDEVYPGAYFMQIVDPDSMVLEATVNQADSQRVRVGQPATVRLDGYPERSWKGRVLSVAAMAGAGGGGGSRRFGGPSSSDYVRNVTVLVEILERDDVIIPDLSASADIVLNAAENVVMAPREALHEENGEWFVWLRSAGEALGFARKPVEVRDTNDTHAVVNGLNEGDEIALMDVKPAQR